VAGRTRMSTDEVRRVVLLATRAPSIHNTQPWRWHAAGDMLDLYADRSRGLRHADAAGRQLLTSCGMALLFARVALGAAGRQVRWELLPDLADHDHLARLTVGGERSAEPADVELGRAIDTTLPIWSDPVGDRPLPAELRRQLGADAAAEGAWLRWIESAADRSATDALIARANRIRHADPAYLGELRHWQPVGGGDGRPGPARQPELAVVGTDHEGPASWLFAGQAIGRVLLRLTVAGAAAAPVDPVLDLPWTRDQLRSRLGLAGFAQLLLRLGYASRAPVLLPRRPVEDVLKIDTPA
jgi:nitroreductase